VESPPIWVKTIADQVSIHALFSGKEAMNCLKVSIHALFFNKWKSDYQYYTPQIYVCELPRLFICFFVCFNTRTFFTFFKKWKVLDTVNQSFTRAVSIHALFLRSGKWKVPRRFSFLFWFLVSIHALFLRSGKQFTTHSCQFQYTHFF